MKIRTRELIPNILELTFETGYDLAMSFVRIQEFYESPKFQGQVFSLEDYMDYWAKEYGEGAFDYPVRWRGFNIPGKVLSDWMYKFGYDDGINIRDKERELIKKIFSRYKREDLDNVYIIGVAKGADKKSVVDHEVAHALYALYPKYRNKCKRILTKLYRDGLGRLLYEKMEDKILEMGYAQDVVEDEIQAYWAVPSSEYVGLEKSFDELKELQNFYRKFRREAK